MRWAFSPYKYKTAQVIFYTLHNYAISKQWDKYFVDNDNSSDGSKPMTFYYPNKEQLDNMIEYVDELYVDLYQDKSK